MKNLYQILGVWALTAALAAAAVPARAEMYVEAYIGGNFGGNTSDPISGSWAQGGDAGPFSFHFTGKIDPAVAGGLKAGTWFVPEGFLGMNYPAWMKYLGFYLDFSYHRLNFRQRMGVWHDPTIAEAFLDIKWARRTIFSRSLTG